MNVTHETILALLVIKDQRIMTLEAQLAAALADAQQLRERVKELEQCPSRETSPTPS